MCTDANSKAKLIILKIFTRHLGYESLISVLNKASA